jgi:hypothetical protein
VQAILDHIDAVVRPALRNYSAAEATFTAAQNDAAGVDEALNQVMLTARQAANELHHLADFVFNKRALKGRQTRRPLTDLRHRPLEIFFAILLKFKLGRFKDCRGGF